MSATPKRAASIVHGSFRHAPEEPDQAQLIASAEMTRALLEAVPQAIIGADRLGRIVLANRHAEEMFGYSSQELLSLSVDKLIPEAQRSSHAQSRGQYTRQPKVRAMGTGVDLTGCRKDGTEFPVEVGLSHIETAGGAYAVAFVSDISRRKRPDNNCCMCRRWKQPAG